MTKIPVPQTRSLTITPAGQAQFRFPYAAAAIAELKEAIPGVTWNGRDAWTVRVRPANIRAITTYARAHGFEGTQDAAATQVAMFADARESICASYAPDADWTPPATLRGTLRPFQRAGAAYAVRVQRALIADEMGLGKTIETIAALESLQAFPAIIVTPASLMLNWQRELSAWLPHRTVHLVDAEHPPTPGQDAYIVNYNILPKHVASLRKLKPKATVFDEGHHLKTYHSQRSKAARALRKRVPYRFILTGTPMLNRAAELISPLAILGQLDELGGYDHFVQRYCGGHEKEITIRGGVKKKVFDISGSSNLQELAGRLRATCMVRRRKRDVLRELPPKQFAMLPVDIDNRPEYERAQRDVLAWIAQRAGQDPEFREKIAHLDPDQQIAAVLQRAQGAADRAAQARELVRLNALRQISARGKLAAAEEWILNFAATGEKLLVFAWHQEILDTLGQRLAAPIICGQTPIAARQRMVDAFQRDRAVQIQLLNLQAGGVGLTFTAASHCLFLELPWTSALLDQAVDREHRIGQHNPVTAWCMLGRRTIDYPVWKLTQTKRTILEDATH